MQSGRVCEFRSSNQKFFGSIPALKNLEKIKEKFLANSAIDNNCTLAYGFSCEFCKTFSEQ